MSKKTLYLKIMTNLVVSVAILAFIVFLGPKLLSFFFPFVLAYIISAIANPFVRFLEHKVKILRKFGTALIIVLTILAILGILYLIISFLVEQIISFFNDIPSIAETLMGMLDELSVRLTNISDRLPNEIKDMVGSLSTSLEGFLSGLLIDGIKLPSILESAGAYVRSIANGFIITIVTIVSSYIFIADRHKLSEMLKKVLPKSFISGYELVTQNLKSAVGGYFKAQFKLMLIISAILWIAFQIMGIKYAVLIALLIGLIDLLPVFGTGVILGPWAIVLLIANDYVRAIVLIALYIICQVVKQVLQPKMVGDSVGLSPLSALVFMFIGYRIYGVIGMIIGIPIGMILINFYRIGAFNRIVKGFRIIAADIDEYRKF